MTEWKQLRLEVDSNTLRDRNGVVIPTLNAEAPLAETYIRLLSRAAEMAELLEMALAQQVADFERDVADARGATGSAVTRSGPHFPGLPEWAQKGLAIIGNLKG